MKKIFVFVLLSLIVGCFGKKGPDSVLKSYIDLRFSSGVKPESFSQFFRGELLEQMNALTDKDIERLNNIGPGKRKFKLDYKRCEEKRCFLTYSLTYQAKAQAENEKSDVFVKVKKIAEMAEEDNEWKIVGISDVKTHYDYQPLGK